MRRFKPQKFKKKKHLREDKTKPTFRRKKRIANLTGGHSEAWWKRQELTEWEKGQIELAAEQITALKKKLKKAGISYSDYILSKSHPKLPFSDGVKWSLERFKNKRLNSDAKTTKIIFQPSLPPSERARPLLLANGDSSIEDLVFNPLYPVYFSSKKNKFLNKKNPWKLEAILRIRKLFNVETKWYPEKQFSPVKESAGDWVLTTSERSRQFPTKDALIQFAKKLKNKKVFSVLYVGDKSKYSYKRFTLSFIHGRPELEFVYGEKK